MPPQPSGSSHGSSAPGDEDRWSSGRQIISRIRRRVDEAAREIESLRRENRALKARLDELEQQPRVEPGRSVLPLHEHPDDLRRRLDEYIAAIDHLLSENP